MAGKRKANNQIFLRSETDLFTEAGYDVTVQSTEFTNYYPTTAISDANVPITFFIPGDDSHYIDLSELLLLIRGNVVDKDGKNIPAWDGVKKVAFVNNTFHALFDQCTVHLNETQITPTTNTYSYRAHLETLLSFRGDQSDTLGPLQGYYPTSNIANEAHFKYTHEMMEGGKEIEMISRPHVDMCFQTRYLIPGIDVRFAFNRSRPEFYMLTDQVDLGCRFQITQARLIVKRHTLLPSILANHLKIWNSGYPVCYPHRKIDVKAYTIPNGSTASINENILTGQIPDRIVVAMVPNKAFHGNYAENSYIYEAHDLKSIEVTANGDHIFHQKFDVDFKAANFAEAFYNLFSTFHLDRAADGPQISHTHYKKGRTLFCFNLRDYKEGFTVPRFGNVRIALQFKEALKEALTVIVHADYQGVLQIDKHKNVYFKDFSNFDKE